MRMWMVPPRLMCGAHLSGEHSELHKHKHNFEKHHSVAGRYGQIEPTAMQWRHDALAAEINRRTGNHQSPYSAPNIDYLPEKDHDGRVDMHASYVLLWSKCPRCRARMVLARNKTRIKEVWDD